MTPSISSVLAELAPDLSSATQFEYLAGGYSNDNYRIRFEAQTYALRIRRKPPPPKFEAAYLRHGLGPEVVAYDAATGHMLSRWVDGNLAAEDPLSLADAIDYLRDIHARIPRAINRYDVAAHIRAATGNDPRIERLIEMIGWRPEALSPCHNDLNPWNIIRTPNGYCTLDWEYAGDNDPVFDLVGFAHGAGFSSSQLLELATGYDPSIADTRLSRTRAIFLLREHAWAVGQIAIGNDRAEILAQRDDCLALVHDQIAGF